MARFPVRTVSVALICLVFPALAHSQGPLPGYYFDPATELGFAECRLAFDGGSHQKLPFFPVINRAYRVPLGLGDYEHDLEIRGQLVFIGDGVVEDERDSYSGRRGDYSTGGLDVAGKVVVFCYDCPAPGTARAIPLETRLEWAESRRAAAAVLFSLEKSTPLVAVNVGDTSGIPAITISRDSVPIFFTSSGEDGQSILETWMETGSTPFSRELITKLELRIRGGFETVQSPHFVYRFADGIKDQPTKEEIVTLGEKALALIFETLPKHENQVWKTRVNTFFPDFDSKVFFTAHWGRGLANDKGSFVVLGSNVPDYDLVVHETTHLYTAQFWSKTTSSFMDEGVATFLEAQSVQPERNHQAVLDFMKDGTMVPLAQLVEHQIGEPGHKTEVGYPASGSLVGYLIQRYGFEALRNAYVLEARTAEQKADEPSWTQAFGQPLAELEQDWLQWLQTQNHERE